MNARFYNPSTARFLTQDSYTGNPYEPRTQHLYSYCANDPINYTDPTGHMMRSDAEDGGSTPDPLQTYLDNRIKLGGGGGSSSGNGGTSNNNIVDKVMKTAFPGVMERYENRNNSLYDGINYWTFGLAETVNGAFNPDKPLSLQHWIDSATVALMLVPGMKFASDEIGALTSKSIISNEAADKVKTQLHHTIPEYMGGRKNQELFEIVSKQHSDLHEFIDNYDLPEGMKARSPAPKSFGGPVRPWGRENAYLKEFASQSLENRKFIVDNLRNMYREHGVYDDLKEIFDNESEIFLKGGK